MSESSNNKRMFEDVKQGERPRAEVQNKIQNTLMRLTASPNEHKKSYSRVRLMRTGEAIGQFSTGDARLNASAQFMHFTHEDASDHSSQSRDLGAGFVVSDRAPVNNVCDPQNLVYDRHEIMLGVYLEQSSKWIPLTGRTVRHAITCRANNTYPARSVDPDTYPIQWVRLRFHEDAGRKSHDLSYLASDVGEAHSDQSSLFSESSAAAPTAPDAYVHNIVAHAYIPRGTIIEVYNVGGQWFTERRAEPALMVRPIRTINRGGTDKCRICSNEVPTGSILSAKAIGSTVYANHLCLAWQEESSGNYYVGPLDCPDGTSDSSQSQPQSSVS